MQGGIRGPGCTPWQFVELSEEQIKHEITVRVSAPLEYCYSVWADRLNYTEWFDLIAEVRRCSWGSLLAPQPGTLPCLRVYAGSGSTALPRGTDALGARSQQRCAPRSAGGCQGLVPYTPYTL